MRPQHSSVVQQYKEVMSSGVYFPMPRWCWAMSKMVKLGRSRAVRWWAFFPFLGVDALVAISPAWFKNVWVAIILSSAWLNPRNLPKQTNTSDTLSWTVNHTTKNLHCLSRDNVFSTTIWMQLMFVLHSSSSGVTLWPYFTCWHNTVDWLFTNPVVVNPCLQQCQAVEMLSSSPYALLQIDHLLALLLASSYPQQCLTALPWLHHLLGMCISSV